MLIPKPDAKSDSKNTPGQPKQFPPLPDKLIVSPPQHHYVRTFFASIFGILALNLIIASVLVVWLNRTLTDTSTYVRTVAPLVSTPDIQQFLVAKTTDALLRSNPASEIAPLVLSQAEVAGLPATQLEPIVRSTVQANIKTIVDSPKFQDAWTDTNRSAHASLMSQLQAGAPEITIDLSPLVNEVTSQLKTTQLSAVSDQIVLPQDAGKLALSGAPLTKAVAYYKWIQTGTILIVVTTLVSAALCIWISVHHTRTLRRIMFGSGLSALLIAAALRMPSLIQLEGLSDIDRAAAIAFVNVLFHDLFWVLITLGSTLLILGIVSKVISVVRK